jgi:hypothetical protein
MKLTGVLETVLYYAPGEEEALARFYGEVLGLQRVGREGLTFRVGQGLLLLFDRERSVRQSNPPPHGAVGSIHTCFVAAADNCETWKQRLVSHTFGSSTRSYGAMGSRRSTCTIRPGICSRSQTGISGLRISALSPAPVFWNDA